MRDGQWSGEDSNVVVTIHKWRGMVIAECRDKDGGSDFAVLSSMVHGGLRTTVWVWVAIGYGHTQCSDRCWEGDEVLGFAVLNLFSSPKNTKN